MHIHLLAYLRVRQIPTHLAKAGLHNNESQEEESATILLSWRPELTETFSISIAITASSFLFSSSSIFILYNHHLINDCLTKYNL